MTNEEKKLAMNVVVQGLIDIAGGVAAVDIFKKAVSTLPTKYGFMHSLGRATLAFGAFHIGMELAEKGTKPFVDPLFKVKLDTPDNDSKGTEVTEDPEGTDASEDDISYEEKEEE